MGNISSRPDEGSVLYLKDQTRFSITSLVISNGRRKVVLNLSPNAYPASKVNAKKDPSDESPLCYIQDPESSIPAYLPRIDLEDELDFRFTFVSRQNTPATSSASVSSSQLPNDTAINGLTFAYAQNAKDLDKLITREFHADPNLHKNSNVQLVGDFATAGSPAVEYQWNWQWRPPRLEDRGGGWRNSCSFLEYDSRAHRLNTLASFAFWIHNTSILNTKPFLSPTPDLTLPVSRHRMPSSQSYQSAVSDSEGPFEGANPPSPLVQSSEFGSSTTTIAPPIIDVLCQRPGEDMSAVEDGPVFRATMKSLEQKTGNMKIQIKKVLKKAEAAQQAQVDCNLAMSGFLGALQEASGPNASAFKPALDHYFAKIAQRILNYEKEHGILLQKQIIDPLTKLYNLDIKQVESKKKDFDDESRDYYAYVGRYLGQRQDSLKEKKRAESDSKYQTKKRTFELKRFDYSSFMQDLHGGRKEQELLSQLTKYADGQAKSFLAAAKKVESLTPQLDALVKEVAEADKEYNLQRREREEKRRNLEKNTPISVDTEHMAHVTHVTSSASSVPAQSNQGGYNSDTDLSRADSTSSQFGPKSSKTLSPSTSVLHSSANGVNSTSPGLTSTPSQSSKFKGIRDLEERDTGSTASDHSNVASQRKEGLLWALSKPGSHIDPKGINKQAWHKFWIVLDQGKLSEYSNWKDKLDLHREPIDLRMASVRMARDAERRFCFEVITPHYKRVYQTTAEEEMNNWINAINNALQSAVEGRSHPAQQIPKNDTPGRDYGPVLTGKSSSQSGPHGHSHRNDPNSVNRRVTVGARPSYVRTNSNSFDENPSKLLDRIRENDQGNAYCADCGTAARVEWVSINLGIVLCIECGGIHRSLGTHVSKVRSLTLDINSFTTDIVELLLLIGNRISNMVWEARLDRSLKPEPHSTRDQRLKFITAKYVERAYVEQPVNGPHTSTDDRLLTSIKKNEIQSVLLGIAQRANVNAHDRSRNTHAIFLALAAADPAYPAGTGPAASILPQRPKSPAHPSDHHHQKAFPMAELLVQNGAEIPVEPPPIPLSSAAQIYIEQRTSKAPPASDTLGPLPKVSKPGSSSGPGPAATGGADGTFSNFGGSGGGLLTLNPTANTSSRLQKRGSAGARFAGKVTGLGGER